MSMMLVGVPTQQFTARGELRCLKPNLLQVPEPRGKVSENIDGDAGDRLYFRQAQCGGAATVP